MPLARSSSRGHFSFCIVRAAPGMSFQKDTPIRERAISKLVSSNVEITVYRDIGHSTG
jgi:hypothetical protein